MDSSTGFKNLNLKKAVGLNMDKGAALLTYNKYKGFTLPLIVILASILIFIFIVIPEVNQYFASQKQLKEDTQKLDTLKNNYNFLTNLDQAQEEIWLKSLTKALPAEKDFFSIMTGVSAAASISNVGINNYKFYLGNLSKLTGVATQYPTISMKIVLTCFGSTLNEFINNLYKTAPLVEVSNIKYSDGKADLDLNFYFKPFPPQNISDNTPVVQLSKNELDLISLINSWNNLLDQQQGLNQVVEFGIPSSLNSESNASESAQVRGSPFQ